MATGFLLIHHIPFRRSGLTSRRQGSGSSSYGWCEKRDRILNKIRAITSAISEARREIYNYEPQSHLEHMESLQNYLRIKPQLGPRYHRDLARRTITHPDLQPNNVFVSEDLEITGVIDWQHCSILPLFLQCGIPASLQNYGDVVSDTLQTPQLPPNFDELGEREQFEQVLLFRKRQLHYFYVTRTAKLNLVHHNALARDSSICDASSSATQAIPGRAITSPSKPTWSSSPEIWPKLSKMERIVPSLTHKKSRTNVYGFTTRKSKQTRSSKLAEMWWALDPRAGCLVSSSRTQSCASKS
jgi:hypothetical protein